MDLTDADPTIGRLVAKSADWMILLRGIIRSLGFIRTIVLARIPRPSNFDLVALTMMILDLAEVITILRLVFALTQNTRAERLHCDTV